MLWSVTTNLLLDKVVATDQINSQGLFGTAASHGGGSGRNKNISVRRSAFERSGGFARTLSINGNVENVVIRDSSFSYQWQADTFTNAVSPSVTMLLDNVSHTGQAIALFPQEEAAYAADGSPAFPWTSSLGIRHE
jgi:hypothetical protein